MANEINWSLDSYPLRKRLMILSMNDLKKLCKSRNVIYSDNKSETVNRLLDSAQNANSINNKKKKSSLSSSSSSSSSSCIEKKQSVVLKVGILGDRQIGGRSLMIKYIEDKYDEDYLDTLGVNFMEKTLSLKNLDVTISIWIHMLLPLICHDAKCIIFAFDLTSKRTLYSVKRYYKESRLKNKYYIPFLVGTKYDLYQEMNNDFKLDITKQARKFATKMGGAPLIFCSALNGTNIKKIFKLIVAKVFDLNPKIDWKHNELNEAIIECSYSERELIFIVNGYIRSIQQEYEWGNIMPAEDFSNIILLFYANIVIGDNNKDYKLESRKVKKMQKQLEREKRKKQKKEKKAKKKKK